MLQECPLALEAVQELLSLGVRGAEVASFMINIPGSCAATEWFVSYTCLHIRAILLWYFCGVLHYVPWNQWFLLVVQYSVLFCYT